MINVAQNCDRLSTVNVFSSSKPSVIIMFLNLPCVMHSKSNNRYYVDRYIVVFYLADGCHPSNIKRSTTITLRRGHNCLFELLPY